jgi:predicted enzyme related to lactoylglutathione lyase
MGHPVVHFEITGKDGTSLAAYYSSLFGPDEVPGTGVVLGQFADPEGHVIGVMQRRSA